MSEDLAMDAAQHVYPGATVSRAVLITEQIRPDGTRELVSTGSNGLTLWDALGMVGATAEDVRLLYGAEKDR